MQKTHGQPIPEAKPDPGVKREDMSRRYRRYRGKRTIGLSSSVHAKKAPASLYREPGDPRFAQDGLNHAQQRRADWTRALKMAARR